MGNRVRGNNGLEQGVSLAKLLVYESAYQMTWNKNGSFFQKFCINKKKREILMKNKI